MDKHETWMRDARCARFPHLGWVKDRDQVNIAETVTMAVCCARCPVFFACEAFASGEDIVSGFWAGEHRDPLELAVGGAA